MSHFGESVAEGTPGLAGCVDTAESHLGGTSHDILEYSGDDQDKAVWGGGWIIGGELPGSGFAEVGGGG